MFSSLTAVIEAAGLPALVLVMFLETVFPPVPSEIVLPFAGYYASTGAVHLIGVVLASTLGSVLGALTLYWVGTLITEEQLKDFIRRHGKWAMLAPKDIDSASHWFAKYGHWAVLIGRFIPLVRSLISLPAGLERMNLSIFLTYTVIGTLCWNSLLAVSGYILGVKYAEVEHMIAPISSAVIAVLGISVVGFILYRLLRKRPR
jgi:membrane protein DedA with SNARE-associated domain